MLNRYVNIFFPLIFLIFSDVFENSYLKYAIYVWSIQAYVISRQRPTLHKLLNPAYISNLKIIFLLIFLIFSNVFDNSVIYAWSIQQSLSNTLHDSAIHEILNPVCIWNLWFMYDQFNSPSCVTSAKTRLCTIC